VHSADVVFNCCVQTMLLFMKIVCVLRTAFLTMLCYYYQYYCWYIMTSAVMLCRQCCCWSMIVCLLRTRIVMKWCYTPGVYYGMSPVC